MITVESAAREFHDIKNTLEVMQSESKGAPFQIDIIQDMAKKVDHYRPWSEARKWSEQFQSALDGFSAFISADISRLSPDELPIELDGLREEMKFLQYLETGQEILNARRSYYYALVSHPVGNWEPFLRQTADSFLTAYTDVTTQYSGFEERLEKLEQCRTRMLEPYSRIQHPLQVKMLAATISSVFRFLPIDIAEPSQSTPQEWANRLYLFLQGETIIL